LPEAQLTPEQPSDLVHACSPRLLQAARTADSGERRVFLTEDFTTEGARWPPGALIYRLEGAMRVTTRIDPQTRPSVAGFFFSKKPPVTEYFVEIKVELSQEERAILDQYDLWDYGLHKTTFRYSADYLEKTPSLAADNNTPITHTVRHFVVGFEPHGAYRWKFNTPAEAAAFQLKAETEIMPLLKQLIQDNNLVGELPSTTRTFNL
jgi:hypothetical protein